MPPVANVEEPPTSCPLIKPVCGRTPPELKKPRPSVRTLVGTNSMRARSVSPTATSARGAATKRAAVSTTPELVSVMVRFSGRASTMSVVAGSSPTLVPVAFFEDITYQLATLDVGVVSAAWIVLPAKVVAKSTAASVSTTSTVTSPESMLP